MRVLQLHTRYRYSGGEDRVVDSEASLLEEAGHEVHQLIESNPASEFRAAIDLALSLWNPAPYRRAREAVATFKPDVAHVHNTWFSMSPSVVAALRADGVPIVMTLHNYRLTCSNALLFRDGSPCTLCVGSHPWHAVRYGCYRNSRLQSVPAAATIAFSRRLRTWTDNVNVFLALTEFQRNVMIRAGLPERKIAVRPNFVPDPGPRDSPPSESETVLYVGRLSEEKGVDIVIQAWRRADPALELLIIGDGPSERKLRAESPPSVRFLGRLEAEQVSRLMLKARAGLLPSRWYEGLPMTMLEFFAAGTPVLMSDIGSIGAIGARVGAKWTVGEEPRSWTSALQQLTDTTVDEGGRAARSLYEGKFTPERQRDSLLAIYGRVMGSDPRAQGS